MNKVECEHCGKMYSYRGIHTHIWRTHGAGKDHKPTTGLKPKTVCCDYCERDIDIRSIDKHQVVCALNPVNKVNCLHCDALLTTRKSKFCDNSCAAKYNNLHRVRPAYTKVSRCVLCNKYHIKYRESKICDKCNDIKLSLVPKFIKPYTKVYRCRCCKQYHTNARLLYCELCSPNARHYRTRAKFKFNVYEHPEKFDLSLVEEHGWYSPGGKRSSKVLNYSGVSRDHMYSVRDGFENNVDPKLLAHPANCRIMVHNGPNGNNSKNSESVITLNELLVLIENWKV